MKFFSSLIFLFQLNFSQAAETQVCSASGVEKTKIETCFRSLEENHCEDFPSSERVNCYEPSDYADVDLASQCAQGGVKGIKDTLVGLYNTGEKIISNGYQALTNNSKYLKEVRTNAGITCQSRRDVKEAKDYANQVIQNVGRDAPQTQVYLNKAQDVYMACFNEEVSKGRTLGVTLSLPEYSEIKAMYNCLKPAAKIETGCAVVVPMVAGGVASAAIKSTLTKAIAAKNLKAAAHITQYADDYLAQLSSKNISKNEFYSLMHQQDLVSLMMNPETNRLMNGMKIDMKAFANGMLDSDLGKLGSYKKVLVEKSPTSDQLFNILKGSDQSSVAGKAFSEFLQEKGLGSRGLFNKDMSPDEIREVIKSKPVLVGFLHEAPGISEAITQLNSGKITVQQFKNRLGANLFHNGPQAGFWDQLTEKFVSDQLKTPNEKKFFKGTVFEGKTTSDGVVRAQYPNPVTKEGLVHTMADRLSQGTSGGNIKIFSELGGAKLADNFGVKIGEMPNPFGAGTTNGLNMFRDLLQGNPFAKPAIKSNPQMTLEQMAALEKHAKSASFLNPLERENYLALLKSAQDRMKAFHDYMKPPQFEVIKDATGSVDKIILKGPPEAGSKYIATIDKNTPTNEAIAKFENFFKKEEMVHGNPLQDLMKPRKLSPTELVDKKILAGTAAAETIHFYCSAETQQKIKLSQANELSSSSHQKPVFKFQPKNKNWNDVSR